MLARATLAGTNTETIGIPDALHRQRNIEYNQTFERIAALHPDHVNVVDPASVFVDDRGYWRAELDRIAMYADSNHLSIEGSFRLKPLLEQSFKKPRNQD